MFETFDKMIFEIFNKIMFETFNKMIFETFNKIIFETYDKIVFKVFDKIVNEDKVINIKIIEIIIVFDFLKLFIKILMCSKYFIKIQIRLLISNSSNFLL